MKKINIILLIIWMIVIFMFSQDSAVSSTEKSDTIASKIVNIISDVTHNDNIEYYIDSIIVLVRKTAHFLEYLILGVLFINVVKDYKSLTLGVYIFSVVFCMLYASSDEIHQLFISDRSGRIFDVFIDTMGSITGISLFYLIKNRKRTKKQTSKILD